MTRRPDALRQERRGPSEREAAVQWWRQAREVIRDSNWAAKSVIGRIDAFDVLLANMNVRLLALLRQDPPPPTPSLLARIRGRLRAGRVSGKDRVESDRSAGMQVRSVERADVVFWPVEASHVRQMVRVAPELALQGVTYRFVACRSSIADMLEASGEPVVRMRERWGPSPKEGIADGVARPEPLTTDPGVILPHLDGVDEKKLLQATRDVLGWGIPPVRDTLYRAERMIGELAPRVLVVGNDNTLEGRAAALYARQEGVRTATIMHGAIVGEPLGAEHVVDRFLVFGEFDREELLRWGCSADVPEICGAPYLDVVPRQTGRIDPSLTSFLSVDRSRPYVLIASSGPGHSTSRRHLTDIARALMQLSTRTDASFVMKLHPKDSLDFYREIAHGLDSRLMIVPHGQTGFPETIFDWLQGCSVVLTTMSTVAVEAMVMRVPVVTIDFANEFRGVRYIEEGATTHVRSRDELEAAIRALISDSSAFREVPSRAESHVHGTFGPLDGGASLRCALAIARLAS